MSKLKYLDSLPLINTTAKAKKGSVWSHLLMEVLRVENCHYY